MSVDQAVFDGVLLEAAKEVFETMIFMDIENASEPEQTIDELTLLGSITFTGTLEGCLSIFCGLPAAKAIATNMLGIDATDDISEEDICDAIGEVANMVMGSIKSRVQHGIEKLAVSIPSVVTGRQLESNLCDGENKITVTVNIEDEYTAQFSLLYRESEK
ncbi:MAG: chemotaxis protein CheX [Planctomycetes bacterium]|nr:chemotaxis protein CheX [Planctomycetota bacterium]